MLLQSGALSEKCLYFVFIWSLFSRIWTEYGEMRSISPYSLRMRENTDQKISKYGYFSRSAEFIWKKQTLLIGIFGYLNSDILDR